MVKFRGNLDDSVYNVGSNTAAKHWEGCNWYPQEFGRYLFEAGKAVGAKAFEACR
jgi:hypothetical protein